MVRIGLTLPFLPVETENFAVLPREFIHRLCLLLVHEKRLFALEKFISGRAGNECRGPAVTPFPNILRFVISEKNREDMACAWTSSLDDAELDRRAKSPVGSFRQKPPGAPLFFASLILLS